MWKKRENSYCGFCNEKIADGKETEPETFAEAFISVPLTEGKHDIELIYTTPGLKTGAMISLGCLIIFLLTAFWRGKQEKNIVVSESLC